MTTFRLVEVMCDCCFESLHISCLTSADIRDVAKKEHGWHRTRGVDGGGRDICADCWSKGLR